VPANWVALVSDSPVESARCRFPLSRALVEKATISISLLAGRCCLRFCGARLCLTLEGARASYSDKSRSTVNPLDEPAAGTRVGR